MNNLNPNESDSPEPASATGSSPDVIRVDLAMLYTLWGRAVLLRKTALADELESLLLEAAAVSDGAGKIDAALANVGARALPFERSPMDLAIAKILAASDQRSEFRMFGFRGNEIAGYLLHHQKTEYIGTPWQHLVRHARVTELLPIRTAMSAFHAVSRGTRQDYALVTDFDLPSQLRVRLGTACSRYKLMESRYYPHATLRFFPETGIPAAGGEFHAEHRVEVRVVQNAGHGFAIECVRDADLLQFHAALHQAAWVCLDTTAYRLVARLPVLEENGSVSIARFHAHRTLRALTGIPGGVSLPLPRPLVMRLLQQHRWFAPARLADWLALLVESERLKDLPTDDAESFEDEPEGWLIS